MFQRGIALGAVREQIRRQPHRRLRREDVVPARDVLLEDVVLHRAAQLGRRHALLLGDELVEKKEKRRGRVDRHRRRHAVERDRVEQDLHVGERVDRDAGAADLAERARVVGVVAELRRQVERDRQPRLPVVEEVAVAGVRLLGRREARVLADRPRPAAVHVAVRAAGERRLARQLELAGRVVAPCRPASARSPTRSSCPRPGSLRQSYGGRRACRSIGGVPARREPRGREHGHACAARRHAARRQRTGALERRRQARLVRWEDRGRAGAPDGAADLGAHR